MNALTLLSYVYFVPALLMLIPGIACPSGMFAGLKLGPLTGRSAMLAGSLVPCFNLGCVAFGVWLMIEGSVKFIQNLFK